MDKKTKWIWITDNYRTDKQMCLFRKHFFVPNIVQKYRISVSADSRYILFINGQRVGIGPCKATSTYKYYEVYNIAQFLVQGNNIIAAAVCHQPNDKFGAISFETGSISTISSDRGGFVLRDDDNTFSLSSNSSWKCKLDVSYSFTHSVDGRYAGDMETVDGRLKDQNWNIFDYDDSNWCQAVEITDTNVINFYGVANNWHLIERSIPYLYERNVHFKKVTRGINILPYLQNGSGYTVPANSEFYVELDMGELTTAYINLELYNGKDAEITLLYAESYYTGQSQSLFPAKGIRDNSDTGFLYGESDKYMATDGLQHYEPFFFRTFRFIGLRVITSNQALTIRNIELRETGYPLDIQAEFESNRENDKLCFDISIRTLKRCMHETYEDCPYYEQMQYILDTMLQALFTYNVSTDYKLIEKAIDDFYNARRPDGIIPCNSPSQIVQIIPGFSVYWICMVKNHYIYTGDKNFIYKYLPAIEDTLNFFKSRIDSGTGLVKDCGYWEFVDWVDEWTSSWGSCMSRDENYEHYNYIYNMMFAYAISEYTYLCREVDRYDVSHEFELLKTKLLYAIKIHAYDADKQLYNYRPNSPYFSCHAQIWAVLSGLAEGDEAKNLMSQCLNNVTLLKTSFSYTFFYFRALEKAGIYNLGDPLWKDWINLLELGVTTWPEDLVTQRSECHGWSGIQLYEYLSCILGVTPLLPGYKKVRIHPLLCGRSYANGRVCTQKGIICVEWKLEMNTFSIHLKLPEIMNVELILPDNSVKCINSDEIFETCLYNGS